MIDDWFEVIRLPISLEQFHALPRNPAYKYEYLGDYALLSPRPKSYRAILELRAGPVPELDDAWGSVRVRPLGEEDWDALPELFANAFCRVPPFVAIDEGRRLEAARACLEKTRSGGDGPLIGPACFVAVHETGTIAWAAALITREGRFLEAEVEALVGDGTLPHLTWIFVAPPIARHGVGSALLGTVVNALVGLGQRHLVSSFLLGNESSTLWHWSNGFRLVSYAGSPRSLRAGGRRRRAGDGATGRERP